MTEQQKDFLPRAIIRQEKYETISKQMGVNRQTLSQWWEELKKEWEELSAIRQLWRSKLNDPESVTDTFEEFHQWYLETDRNCYYCGISEEQIERLWKLNPELTKWKRGKTLEIDRMKPNESYEDT